MMSPQLTLSLSLCVYLSQMNLSVVHTYRMAFVVTLKFTIHAIIKRLSAASQSASQPGKTIK